MVLNYVVVSWLLCSARVDHLHVCFSVIATVTILNFTQQSFFAPTNKRQLLESNGSKMSACTRAGAKCMLDDF